MMLTKVKRAAYSENLKPTPGLLAYFSPFNSCTDLIGTFKDVIKCQNVGRVPKCTYVCVISVSVGGATFEG